MKAEALARLAAAGFVLLLRQSQPAPAWDGSFRGAADMDWLIEQAVQKGEIPGAVVLVGQGNRILFHKAYGSRALVPRREPMTLDTIFDAASLTKVVATTTAIMQLVEQGRIRLADPVTLYLPEFQNGKSAVTVLQLLTHFSGLAADVDLNPEWTGYDTGIQKALRHPPVAAPGTKFVYSDINFVLLGEIVRRISGQSLDEYCRKRIFLPLGMRDTMFRPAQELVPRIAPTEQLGAQPPLRGTVHDPTARFMGGVAGHAGLFTTAADLARFAQMMLNEGSLDGVRIASPLTIRKFTSPQSPPGAAVIRGLGWDIDSPLSAPRGDLFPVGSYGHTGFTGTSVWIDPSTRSYVILMTNRVHPVVKPVISGLRSRVASIAAASVSLEQTAVAAAQRSAVHEVLTGIDVLEQQGFAPLKGKRLGLITNHTGRTRDGRRTIDALLTGGVQLKALFAPEHGFSGTEDREDIDDSVDKATGLKIWSLYKTAGRRPTPEMVKDLDALAFDIQDIGARFYTYVCTMRLAMEEAGRHNLEFYVFDRPNPITGLRVEAPMLAQPSPGGLIDCAALPLRHGMTAGELALLFNQSMQPQVRLTVIRMQGWRRADWFDATNLEWVNPSPNIRSLTAALLYPGVAMLEYSRNYSVGRGTDAPFEQIGASWIQGRQLAAYLNSRAIPGIRVYPTTFRPTASNYVNQTVQGVRFVVIDREAFCAALFGLELAAALHKLYPGRLDFKVNERLIGSPAVTAALAAGEDARVIWERESRSLEKFLHQRQAVLLY